MKIGVITVAFNEPDFIGPCIDQFYGFNFGHLILVCSKPWRGEYEMDFTWAKAMMHNHYGDVELGQWGGQMEMHNYGLQIFEDQDFDWVLIVDADEFYTPTDIGSLVGLLRDTDADVIKTSNMNVYWKTPEYRLTPDQDDNPIIAIRPSKRFVDKRSIGGSLYVVEHTKIPMHHMSYVRTNEQMKKKIETFEHSHEFDTEAWYNNVWLKWPEESFNLHPTIPSKFAAALYNPAPDSIRKLIKWE